MSRSYLHATNGTPRLVSLSSSVSQDRSVFLFKSRNHFGRSSLNVFYFCYVFFKIWRPGTLHIFNMWSNHGLEQAFRYLDIQMLKYSVNYPHDLIWPEKVRWLSVSTPRAFSFCILSIGVRVPSFTLIVYEVSVTLLLE